MAYLPHGSWLAAIGLSVLTFIVTLIVRMATEGALPPNSVDMVTGRNILRWSITGFGMGLSVALLTIGIFIYSEVPKLGVGAWAEMVSPTWPWLRKSPGDVDKPSDDGISLVIPGQLIRTTGRPQQVINRWWWPVILANGFEGWLPETNIDGSPVLIPR